MKYSLKKWPLLLVSSCLLVTPVFSQQSSSSSEDEDIIELDTFVLSEVTSVGYATSSTSGGSRFNVPILDLPQSVISVNRELMEDTGAVDSHLALRYVSGLGPASTVTNSAMTIRGLETRGNSTNILDGLPGGGVEMETEFLDRFEVVKGAAGSLYGQHSLGGLVNRIYKNPLDEQQTSMGFTYSTLGDTYQFTVDNTGPIDKNGQLKYRIVGVYRDGETVSGGADEKEGFYSTLSFSPNEGKSRLWVRGEFRHIKTGHESPSIFYDNEGLPSSDFLGLEIRTVPTPNNEQRDFTYVEFGASHRFDESILGKWDMRLVTRYFRNDNNDPTPDIIPLGFAFVDEDLNIVGTTGTSVPANGGQSFTDTNYTDILLSNAVTRVSGPSNSKNWGVFFDLTGDFKTGPVKHRMLIYSQFQGSRSESKFTNYTIKEEYGGSQFTNNFVPENAFSVLRQNTLPESMEYFMDPVLATDNQTTGDQFAFGIQDNLTFAEGRVLLVGGMRYDNVENGGVDNYIAGTSGATLSQNEWVYKFGAVVKPLPNEGVSIFYNYSETFEAQFGEKVVGSGDLLDNLQGVGEEIGLKLELFEASLVLTASYFDNELESQPIRIFNPNTGLDEFLQGGFSTVEGWEMDMAWQVNEQIGLVVGMSDLDAKNPNGGRLRNVQNDFNYKLLARYAFTEGGLEGLTVGTGVVRVGDRIGSNSQDFVTKGYTTVDAFAYYDWKNWRFQLNAYNLTDVKGVQSSIFSALAIADNPFNVRFSARLSF